MFKSLKLKLIFAISVLIVFLFAVTGFLLIDEKERELTNDIYVRARAFGELTSPKIVDLYESFLAEKSFVIFNREIVDIFNKDEDIPVIKLISFGGEILYDSVTEDRSQYEGEVRKEEDNALLSRVKANNPSFLIEESGRVVYLKKNTDSELYPVDKNERSIEPISDTERVTNMVYPINNKYAVVFDVSYEKLNERVANITERIIYLLIFGVLIGLAFAYFFSSRIAEPLKQLAIKSMIIARGDFKQRVEVRSKDEVGQLSETFNEMAKDLEASTQAKIYKERMAKELEVAAKIQKDILPKVLPQMPGWDVAAGIIPAAEIGGDCYDFIKVDDGCHFLYIGDVTGHGVPSGIVVSIASAVLYSFSYLKNLKDILIKANGVIKAKTSANMFMTMLMLQFDRGNSVKYMSAGHPSMIYFQAKTRKVFEMPGGGMALGMVPDVSAVLAEQTLPMETGDVLLIYSDGIPEASNERGNEMYGMQRLKRAVGDHSDLPSAEAIKVAMLADVEQFIGKGTQNDDITVLVVKKG